VRWGRLPLLYLPLLGGVLLLKLLRLLSMALLHLFFLLVAPEDSASLHLKALARVSRLLKEASFRSHLLTAKDNAEIYSLIKDEDSKY